MIPNNHSFENGMSEAAYIDLLTQFPKYKEAIGLLSPLIEGKLNGHGIGAVRELLQTTIVNHPLALMLGEADYHMQWEKDANGDLAYGKSLTGESMVTLLESEVAQAATIHEQQRAEHNLEFFKQFTALRQQGYTGPMVEFSPSPRLSSFLRSSDIPLAKYPNNDKAAVYTHVQDENGAREEVKELWFASASLPEYAALFRVLSQLDTVPQVKQRRTNSIFANAKHQHEDLLIMDESGQFTPEQLETIVKFAEHHQQKFLFNRPNLREYVNQQLAGDLESELMPDIEILHSLVLTSANPDVIEKQLNKIALKMNVISLQLALLMRDSVKQKRDDAETIMGIENLKQLKTKEFNEQPFSERMIFVEQLIDEDEFDVTTSYNILGGNTTSAGFDAEDLPSYFGDPKYFCHCVQCGRLQEVLSGGGICLQCFTNNITTEAALDESAREETIIDSYVSPIDGV